MPEVAGYWPLIASLKGKDVSKGKSDAILRDVKSAVGPLKQPYTAFAVTNDPSSRIEIRNTRAITISREFTVLTYLYQSSYISDGLIMLWSSSNIIFRMAGKKISILLEGFVETYQATSDVVIEPDTWYMIGASVNLQKGIVSVFVDSRVTTVNYRSLRIMPVSMDDITIGGRGFRGSLSCVQLYKNYMDIVSILAARATCKSYLKKPGDAGRFLETPSNRTNCPRVFP